MEKVRNRGQARVGVHMVSLPMVCILGGGAARVRVQKRSTEYIRYIVEWIDGGA